MHIEQIHTQFFPPNQYKSEQDNVMEIQRSERLVAKKVKAQKCTIISSVSTPNQPFVCYLI